MVNYHDPATIAQEAAEVVKLWHVVDGIFIWEFLTTLDLEWDIIRGRRPYRWTIWVYSMARLATLLAVILNMIGFDTTTPINCQVWVIFAVLFADIAFLSSSMLIILRVIAIWNKSKIILAISMAVLMADVSILFYCLVQLRSTWLPGANTCIILNFDKTKLGVVSSLVTDLALLLIMLLGLLHMRIEAGGAFVLGRVLWNQGLVWLLLATVAEVPSTVLILLNLNAPLNLMTQTPGMIIVTIAATRVYRGLVTFSSSDGSHETPRATGPAASDKWARSGPIPLNRMEVTVQTQYDQYPTPKGGRLVSTDLQEKFKSHDSEVTLDDDVESGPEK